MIKEKSCGAIIYEVRDEIMFLILKQVQGHYTFSKGHVESGEDEVETAKREIKEEVNLEVLIDTSFRKVNTYSPSANIIKDVVYFLAEPITHGILVQESEVTNACWYNYNDASNMLTYESDKILLKEAYDFILNK